ncbi:type II secretion system F family protein [Streptoalloteichus hindustanus]|uniref:Tight adherence protein B n=1 Tax=Streptoalloteichus hindustanus TaxID=2017 RepID=A0A1M4VW10_STRHI|nr:type II secretion system F family protein [Streptoalloteichus hindustanus]SHE73095.1 tight adherence protein B [Streptoalloteichus hindustanus]
MLTAALVLVMAVLVWPATPARRRLRVLRSTLHGGVEQLLRRCAAAVPLSTPSLTVLGGLAGLLLAGPGGAVAGAVTVGTVWARWRARRAEAQRVSAVANLARALRLLVAELRAGAHPATAAEGATADADPQVATVLTTLAAASRLGGDMNLALRAASGEHPVFGDALEGLANAWALSERFGVPLADLVDALCADLDHRVRFTRQVHAGMAGPRATAAVLAALPLLGVLLGEAVGASPWSVLTTSTAGQALLAIGACLICAGLTWSARLTGKAAQR